MSEKTLQDISKICNDKLSEKTSDANAISRLQKELDYISKNKAYAEIFTVASELVSYSRELGYYTTFHGDIGSSLVAFLLGITEINPLKYNLPVEVFTGIHNNKPFVKPLYIALRFDAQFIPMAKRYVRENYPNISIIHREDFFPNNKILKLDDPCLDDCKNFYLISKHDDDRAYEPLSPEWVVRLSCAGNQYCTVLKKLSDTTGVDIFGITFDDKQTMEVLRTSDIGYANEEWDFMRRDITQIVKPKTFEDFVQISGWVHSTYRCLQKDIPKMPAFRDDVFLDLLRSGIDSVTAYEIMECVQKGKDLTDKYISVLANAGISNQYIDNLQQVKYLFPKAHCIALTMTEYRIAWFKVHYPDEFHKVMKMIQN